VYWGRRNIHTQFWLENPKERDHWEDLVVDGIIIILKCVL
jgi:hypothetical protein